ncbi:PIG-L deacetylase family protein [Corynebacterium atypicum]|uniref:PIG-L deacetylase family protein n=1 Tax=Corynebacterium atypicum TaxID=191610 RepID=UPI001F445CF7|nr:PIG-L family deacetylase [Corynebacterium atypicum]
MLLVVAHPDDPEYGASCAVNFFTRHGIEVHYLLLTHGEAGIEAREPEEVALLRKKEQSAACSTVGVSSLEILDHPDGVLEVGLALRKVSPDIFVRFVLT